LRNKSIVDHSFMLVGIETIDNQSIDDQSTKKDL